MNDYVALGYDDLARAALAFVLETETWPVFLEWMREHHATARAHNWLVAGPDLQAWRTEWALRSDDARIRAAVHPITSWVSPREGGEDEPGNGAGGR